MCLSSGTTTVAEHILPEDVVPPETQVGIITPSACSVLS